MDNEEDWDQDDVPQGDLVANESACSRLALYKLDWDICTAVDILAIFQGLCR